MKALLIILALVLLAIGLPEILRPRRVHRYLLGAAVRHGFVREGDWAWRAFASRVGFASVIFHGLLCISVAVAWIYVTLEWSR